MVPGVSTALAYAGKAGFMAFIHELKTPLKKSERIPRQETKKRWFPYSVKTAKALLANLHVVHHNAILLVEDVSPILSCTHIPDMRLRVSAKHSTRKVTRFLEMLS